MAKEKSEGDELSAIGRQTTARAYSAMDFYFDHLKETIGSASKGLMIIIPTATQEYVRELTYASAPSGGTEFGEKVKASAEQNISATQEYVRELTYAKDIQDILRIQTAFVRSQLEAFGEQAKYLGDEYIKAVSGQTTKPPRAR